MGAFGLFLRDSPCKGDITYDGIIALAQASHNDDEYA